MVDSFLTSVAEKIKATLQATIGQWFTLDWIPEIVFWYWWLFLLFVFCGAVIWFFGWSKIVRIVFSMGFLFAAIFVAGGHLMYSIMKGKAAAAEKKAKPKPPTRPSMWGR